MMTSFHPRIGVLAIVAILVCSGPGAASARQSSGAQQRWFELYDSAIADIQARRFAPAETKLLAAQKIGPPPGRSVLRTGATRGPFFPDYYLGIVYQNTGRPKEALDAFARARKQGVDTGSGEFASLDAFEKLARANLPKPVDANLPDSATPTGDPAWYTQYREAIAHIRNREWAQAETQLQAAGKSGPPPARDVLRYGNNRTDFFPDYYLGVVYQSTNRFPEAVSAFERARDQGAEGAINDFGTVATLLAAAQAEVTKASLAATKKEFDGLLAAANQQFRQANYAAAMSTVAKARALSPTNAAEADALVRQLETLLVTGIESDVVAKNAGAARAKHAGLLTVNPKSADAARLAALIDNLEDPRDRRQTLRAVMRLYFRGNYAGALAELKVSATDSRDPAVAARFSFYRACTMAALALSTNPTNSSLMNEARSHYRAALSEAGAFASDLAYISPKILEELAR